MLLKTASTVRIRIALDEELLRGVDQAARRTERSRSSFVREALRAHLHRMEILVKEQQEREGYARHPQDLEEVTQWEAVAAWPPE